MNIEEIIKLTNAVYKVTNLFPAKDPLKIAIRKEALDVLFFSILVAKGIDPKSKGNVFTSLKLLEAYFQISSKQNWVDERNFEILQAEYDKVKQLFEELSKKSKPEKKKPDLNQPKEEKKK